MKPRYHNTNIRSVCTAKTRLDDDLFMNEDGNAIGSFQVAYLYKIELVKK